jgi:phage tail protein X
MLHHLQQTLSYTRKTFNTNIIDGRQYIIYNRHNHIHVKPSTQTSSMASMMFVLKVLRVYDCVCCKWCIVDHRWCLCWRFYVYMIVSVVNDVLSTIDDQSYTRKTFNTNIIDGRQYIIYNRHNHIHLKPSTQTSSMVDNTSFTTDVYDCVCCKWCIVDHRWCLCWRFYVYMIVSVVNDILSTIDGVCVEGFTCIDTIIYT